MLHRRLMAGFIVLLLATLLVGCGKDKDAPPATESPSDPARATADATQGPEGGKTKTGSGDEDAKGIAATVNGESILRSDLERQVARFQAAMISQGYSFSGEEGREAAEQVRQQVLEAMIDEVLIEQAAAEQGISVSEEVMQERIRLDIEAAGNQEAFEQRLTANGLTMDEYRAMMRSTILAEEVIRRLGNEVPDSTTQVHIRQILVDTEAEAQELRQQLQAGADFAELARQFSRDEGTRADGGDRGFVPLGTSALLPEIDDAVASLSPGQIAGPIATVYGYYLVQVVEIQEDRPLSLEMQQGITQENFVKWIEQQRAASTIERHIN